jgi:hypothetical protein
MKLTRGSKLEKELLKEDECSLWPDCACHDNLIKWQEALTDEDRTFSPEQIEWAEEVLFATVACVSAHCPDPKVKAYSAIQLRNLTGRRRRMATVANLAALSA